MQRETQVSCAGHPLVVELVNHVATIYTGIALPGRTFGGRLCAAERCAL